MNLNPINTEGWSKRDGRLYFDVADDVFVQFGADHGYPFSGHVGAATQSFSFVEDALDWCERVAVGRYMITSQEPLPAADPTQRARDRGLAL